MRLHFTLSPNREPVPFAYQHKLTGVFHKWLANNELHDKISLYSLSWLDGSKRVRNKLEFPKGAKWLISFYEDASAEKLVGGALKDPEIFGGMRVEKIEQQTTPDFGAKYTFKVASPVFVKGKTPANGKPPQHYLFNKPEAGAIMTATLVHKMDASNRAANETIFTEADKQIKVSFNREFRHPKIKLVRIKEKDHGQEKYCYLHFDFQGERKYWYQFEDELNAVNKKFLREFIGEKQNDSIVLRKSLYKTLASPEKNLPFPNFSASNIYKTRTFQSEDEVLDLIYAINYSTRATITERDIKIIILPKGKNIEATHIEEFFERRKFSNAANAEEKLIEQNKEELDFLFAPVVDENVPSEIVEFDFVFSKAGGMTSPDVDMIELSGIKRSLLAELAERINEIRQNVEADRERLVGKSDKIKSLNIKWSFLSILGDVTKDKKKYQSHLLKVLPQIYSGTYFKDAVLLPAFIEKTEYNIRQDKSDFNLLKFNYEFLVRIRNNNGENAMEDMKKSSSYTAGKLLGQLAQPVSWEIKSFEKNYVGLLSRRISDKQGLVAFANFINQKLAIHEHAYPSLKEKYIELADILSEMQNKEYHREYCAFGFFEGYFKKFEKPEKTVIEPEK